MRNINRRKYRSNQTDTKRYSKTFNRSGTEYNQDHPDQYRCDITIQNRT